MDDGERVGEQDHPEPAEDSLRDDGGHRGETERAQSPAERPEDGREPEGERADDRTDKPVAVLEEDSPDHAGPREQEHVAAERRRLRTRYSTV